ncbi:MAG: biotin--[acetyl-CoA-carboxylase] ligase [Actinomycetales bacterium]|nr:biotin--[acetyl-CoA-carboxylase] ligase [Actinomycetales bacterium]
MDSTQSRAPLSAEALARLWAQAGLSWPEPVLKPTTASTNDDVEGLARSGAPEGTSVVAEEQTQGRGRLDRTWVSPAGGGLWVSVLVRPGEQPVDRWGLLSLAAGLAAVDALGSASGVRAELKWPNDIVVVAAACGGDGGLKKLGGVLSHAVDGDAIVVGIGINVALFSTDLPFKNASSVLLEGGSMDRAALLVDLLAALSVRVGQWRTGDPALLADYRRQCATIGRFVNVDMPDGSTVSGLVAGVDDDGHLLVSDGEISTRVTAGDVVHATI